MKILVLNAGSSSLKYNTFENLRLLNKGLIEKIGEEVSYYNNKKLKIKNHEQALNLVINFLEKNKIKIDLIAHRVVHGREIRKSVVVTNKILREIKENIKLDPLHNPPEVKVIELCQKLFPKTKNIAVFDTSFYLTIPEYAGLYAIPYNLSKKYKIKRYGFHGISHKYLALETSKILKKPLNKLKIITCHLGNGCSITAIRNGKSIDTSMGFTPLEGLIMGTRSGSIDPYIPLFLMKNEKYSLEKISDLLNEKSGLLGVSGISKDMRLLKNNPNKKAKLAVDMFCYSISKYIGAYIGILNGVDAIVFSAGIGENVPRIRKKILDNFKFLGLNLDDPKNNKNSLIITKPNSKIKVLVIKTNEEIMIVKEALALK